MATFKRPLLSVDRYSQVNGNRQKLKFKIHFKQRWAVKAVEVAAVVVAAEMLSFQ